MATTFLISLMLLLPRLFLAACISIKQNLSSTKDSCIQAIYYLIQKKKGNETAKDQKIPKMLITITTL